MKITMNIMIYEITYIIMLGIIECSINIKIIQKKIVDTPK